jgi:hypothetical protein
MLNDSYLDEFGTFLRLEMTSEARNLKFCIVTKGKYWFHSKNFDFFLLKTRFLPIESHKT